PKVGFITGIGYYLDGLAGALVALIACCIPSIVGSAGISYGLRRMTPFLYRLGYAAGFPIAAMIAAAAWQTARTLHLKLWEEIAVGIITILVGWFDLPIVWVVLAALAAGLAWSLW
ncbi:MAG: chromate transporter, partial [Alicyclobacillus sp.]|nr:chromate transporter [Alicyclobacillus sp.]